LYRRFQCRDATDLASSRRRFLFWGFRIGYVQGVKGANTHTSNEQLIYLAGFEGLLAGFERARDKLSVDRKFQPTKQVSPHKALKCRFQGGFVGEP
jgi:hypothetical protein